MASIETNYHGLHDYSTFSSSTIKPIRDEEGQERTSIYCFLCRLSESLILHPVGPFRCCWDLFVMVLLIYTSIEIPYTVSFGQSQAILLIGLFVDGFLLVDIFLNFHTAYFDKYDNLRLVTNKRYISKKYFRTWFCIDFITCIPFEWIFNPDAYGYENTLDSEEASNASSALLYVKILRIFRLVRIIKILRFVKMLRIFDAFMKQFIIREVLVFMKLFKIIFGMLMFAHFAACLWWFVGSRVKGDTWIDKAEIPDDLPTFQKYSYAWYWAVVTLFTTGYGDIAATNTVEQWVCSICILIGTCFFAYFVGTLTVLITEGDKIKSYELEKLEEAQSFCEKKKLPKELTRAILTHIRYHCTYNYVFDESELLNILPTYLQHDVHTYVAKQFLLQLDIFQNDFIRLPEFIIGLIAVKCKSISCNQSYKLYDVGDFAKTFYIQRTGQSTMYNKNGKILHELSRGSVCGEFSSILFKRRRLLVQCNTWSEFYAINIDDIKEILDLYYPKSSLLKWKRIKKYVKKAYEENVKHSVDINQYNYEYMEGMIQTNNSDGFNAPSMHSVFSFNKNSTMRNTPQQHQYEESIHLFNNTRDRNNSTKTNSEKGPSAIQLHNILEKVQVASPIPPQTPVTPEPQQANNTHNDQTKYSFDTPAMKKKKQITIIAATANLTDSKSSRTPRNAVRMEQRLNRKRAQSMANLTNGERASPIVRTSTPKINGLAKKFHIRSNSEIRDIVVVTHAQKHQKLSTPKGGGLSNSPKGKPKRISDLFRQVNNESTGPTGSFQKYRSEPVLFTSSMETSIIKTNDIEREGPDDLMKKTTSLRSGYSSVSQIDDSECSFASIHTVTDSDSFAAHYHVHSRNNTESKHRDSINVLAKKKRKKEKKVTKKKKGKGKFGGRGTRGGGGGATRQRRTVYNRSGGDLHRMRSKSRSPKHSHRHSHRSRHHNDSLDSNHAANHAPSMVQRQSKVPKLFVYDDRNNRYQHSGYEHDDEQNDEVNVGRQMSIDPAVLLAPLTVKKSTDHENEYVQNIQNININIGATRHENVFVMTPEYKQDNDSGSEDVITYDIDDENGWNEKDKEREDDDHSNSTKEEDDHEHDMPAMMPVIQSNIESI